MTKDQARVVLIALVHDGIVADRLSEKAKQEIRAAVEAILEAVDEDDGAS